MQALRTYLLTLVLLGSAQMSLANDDNKVADWLAIDIATRSLTLDGMAQRIHLLTQGAGLAAQMDADSVVQGKIRDVYQAYKTSPLEHTRWGAKHIKTIKHWLASHPESAARLENIEIQFQQLSTRLRALSSAE